MKLTIILVTIFINFFSNSLIKSEENIDKENITLENITQKESLKNDKSEIIEIHIVKVGDTLSSISKFYSINKNLIIKLNNLKDENYIFVGQNLIISNNNENSINQKLSNIDKNNHYHIIQPGENLTEISNKYKLKLDFLIENNNLQNPDSIEVGEKLFLSKNKSFKAKNLRQTHEQETNKFLNSDKKKYGPIIIQNKIFKTVNGRQLINIRNQNDKQLILSIRCDQKELDVRIPGRKWRGWQPAKEEFENNLINDLCPKFN